MTGFKEKKTLMDNTTEKLFFCIFIMGVSGAGKSAIGSLLAKKIEGGFLEADDYHTENNLNKMKQFLIAIILTACILQSNAQFRGIKNIKAASNDLTATVNGAWEQN